MARVSVTTQKRIGLGQLGSELGTDKLFGPDPETLLSTRAKEIVAEDITEAALQTAIDAHAYNADWGRPAEDRDLSAIRTKAQAVFNGTDTFTAAQMQKLVAGIVLRLTRG